MLLRALAVGLACLAGLGGLHAGAAAASDPLPEPVQQALAAAGLPADALAAVALPLRGGARAWQHHGQRPMQPGSTIKLLTSIVALDRLGPNHRGFTELRSAAALTAGTLQGDLVLQGGADAELDVPELWALLLDLQQAGVRHIAGDLIVDRTRYRPARADLGVPPFDDAPEFPYNAIPDALMLGRGGLLPLALHATDEGVAARTVPPLDGVVLDSRLALVDAPCSAWSAHWQPATVTPEATGALRVTLNGAFPRGCTQRVALSLIDRQPLAAALFRSLWQGLGGSWAGQAREAAESGAAAGTRLLARRTGRPWGELLRTQNKTSDNTWTRLLYLELGVPGMAAAPGRHTAELADAAVRSWLAEHGIGDEGVVLDNGSGLSRTERLSPWQLARALQVAHAGRHASDLMMSLPTAGVDGTLRNRLKDSPATGWARLKTGTLRNVTALAGYVQDAEGRPWAVAMMVNHDTLAARGRPVLDALVDHLARHGPHVRRALPGPQGDGP